MRVKVKICGIKTANSAQAAVNAGADFLGLNFVCESQRYVKQFQAEKIVKKIRGKVKIVGVFQNASCDLVNNIARKLNLDYVQLHGHENREFIKLLEVKTIKAFHLSKNMKPSQLSGLINSFQADFYLLDREKQGTGSMVSRDIARLLSSRFPIILAGGLNPKNVKEAVEYAKPYAVDVAGGVEKNGSKNVVMIRKFIKKAKGKDI